jgi:hypothetical protein
MRAVLVIFTVASAIASASAVNAQQGQNCNQLVNQINTGAASINQNATAYWAHRANFVDLIYGPSSQVVPNAKQLAEQEQSQANALKQTMPGMVTSFKTNVQNAQGQNNNNQGQNNNNQGQNNNNQGCLTPAQQSTIVEPTVKAGKRVNFDQFPPEEELEEKSSPGPPRMPQ